MPVLKSGPLTADELRQVWQGATDENYSDPLVEAGDGNGMEAWTQLFAVMARASKAVDVTTQAMFIVPFSGQTNDPASGARKSTVTLTFERAKFLGEPLLLKAGQVFAVEEAEDWGPEGSVTYRSGRRYALAADLYFPPGTSGPFQVIAEAEHEGYGYDNPLPSSIRAVDQPGTNFSNDLASVVLAPQPPLPAGTLSAASVVADNQPDMFVPDHVGQYAYFSGGSNAGRLSRVIAFHVPESPAGSSVDLAQEFSLGLSPVTGTFAIGETVEVKNGGTVVAYLRVIDDRTVSSVRTLGAALISGTPSNVALGRTLLGLQSAATGTVWNVGANGVYVAEAPAGGVGGASWRILDWVADWGLTVTNVLSPAGGKAAFLDELGNERAIYRAPGEGDDSYRERVHTPADVVSPNAIKRALNRTLSPYPWCLREAGQEGLPGFFFDGNGVPPSATPHGAGNDAYDEDCILVVGSVSSGAFLFQEEVVWENATTFARYATGWYGRLDGGTDLVFVRKSGTIPGTIAGSRIRGVHSGAIFAPTSASIPASVQARRYRTWLDYEQFRGFFLVTVPRLSLGEYGFAYDATGPKWGWDLPGPLGVAYDGAPIGAIPRYAAAWTAVDVARAGGVGFEFRPDDGPCP